MTNIDATPAGSMDEKAMSVKMSKVIQGIGLVFSGVLTMLEAIDTTSAKRLVELATSETAGNQKKGDMKNEAEDAVPGTADGKLAAPDDGVRPDHTDGNDMKHQEGTKESTEPVTKVNAVEGDGTETANGKAAPGVTQDDITRVIVRKIKQDRGNSGKIASILKTYGAAKVSELPAEKYEAFLTDISAI